MQRDIFMNGLEDRQGMQRGLLGLVRASIHACSTVHEIGTVLKAIDSLAKGKHMREYSFAHPSYCVAIKPISFLRRSKEVDDGAVQALADSIREADVWTTPIPIDIHTGIIMDGNHRARAALLLGLDYLPCVLLSYRDPRVRVTSARTGAPFDVDDIYRCVVHDVEMLPYKTTRHDFAPSLPCTEIRLGMLRAASMPS